VDGLDTAGRVSTEEIFGPIVTIHRFTSEEQVIQQVISLRSGGRLA
jgi:acyl-CoA reductase-like NAD-dependent aldehyde dehydrogenase